MVLVYKTEANNVLCDGLVVNNRWKLGGKIASGSDGIIFKCSQLSYNGLCHAAHDQEYALKAELISYVRPSHKTDSLVNGGELRREYEKLKFLEENFPKIVPTPYDYGSHKDFNWYVMELVGNTLHEKLQSIEGRRLSVRDVLLIGIKLLSAVQTLHDAGYLHNDLKPSNIAVSLDDPDHRLVLLDLGRAKSYLSNDTHVPVKYNGENIRGSLPYVSLMTLFGAKCSRRDDIESIFYILLFLVQGRLPWPISYKNREERDEMIERRKQMTVQEMTGALPPCFELFLRLSRSAPYDQAPPYLQLHDALCRGLEQFGGAKKALNVGINWEVCRT